MPDWSWIQSILTWIELVPDWIWATTCVVIGFFVNNFFAPRWKEIRKIKAQIECMPELTKRVEEIKLNMDIIRGEITSTRERGDNSLREFFEKCNSLESTIGTFPSISIITARENMDQYFNSIHRLFDDITLSRRRLLLYFHGDDKIIKQSEKIASVCTYLISIFEKQFPSVDRELTNHIHEFLNQEEVHDVLIEQIEQGQRKYAEAIKTPLGEFKFALTEYSDAMSEYIKNKYKSS